MPTNDFTFNGISASDYDIEVLDVTEEFTSRDGEGIPVSGRTGELYNDNGRYENINVTYSCAIQLGTLIRLSLIELVVILELLNRKSHAQAMGLCVWILLLIAIRRSFCRAVLNHLFLLRRKK